MENGGNNEHAPWTFDEPGSTLIQDIYRKFVNLHYEIVPYLLSEGTDSYEKVNSVIRPITPEP